MGQPTSSTAVEKFEVFEAFVAHGGAALSLWLRSVLNSLLAPFGPLFMCLPDASFVSVAFLSQCVPEGACMHAFGCICLHRENACVPWRLGHCLYLFLPSFMFGLCFCVFVWLAEVAAL